MPKRKPRKGARRKKFELGGRQIEKLEVLLDFLIKFNLLAIPMYIAILAGLELYPLQQMLTNVVYTVVTALGYEAAKDGITLMLISQPYIAIIVMGVDCTAWKSMYALAALAIASPVPNDKKKWRFIVLGVMLIFALNIVRLVTTVLVGYWYGMWYLDVTHNLLWREGMIFAVVAIWAFWIKKQKVIFRRKQTILRKLLERVDVFAKKKR